MQPREAAARRTTDHSTGLSAMCWKKDSLIFCASVCAVWGAVEQCSTVQCSAVQCSLMQCSAMHCSLMQCSAVQCSAVQCSAVQCSAVQCSLVQCSAMQCSAVQCSAVQCSAVQCSAVQCSAVQCSAVQCCAVQCSEVQCCAVQSMQCQTPCDHRQLRLWWSLSLENPGRIQQLATQATCWGKLKPSSGRHYDEPIVKKCPMCRQENTDVDTWS